MIDETRLINKIAEYERTLPNIGRVCPAFKNENKILQPYTVLHSTPGFTTEAIGYPRRWRNRIEVMSALFGWNIAQKGGRWKELEDEAQIFLLHYRRKFQEYDTIMAMMELGTGNPHFSLVSGAFGALPELVINADQWIGCVFRFIYDEVV